MMLFSKENYQWKNYSCTYDAVASVPYKEGAFTATSGGLYYHGFSDSSYYLITKSEGLTSQKLSSLAVDSKGRIWTGSTDGVISIFDPKDKSISEIFDIYHSDLTQKGINAIAISGDSVMVATDFGLSLINANNLSFYETAFRLGTFPSQGRISAVYYSGSSIFASTDNGIAVLKTGNSNISSPDSWTAFPLTGFGVSKINSIEKYQGNIIAGTNNGVYSLKDGKWTPIYHQGYEVMSMKAKGDSLYVSLYDKLYLETPQGETKISEGTGYNSFYRDDSRICISTAQGLKLISGNQKSSFLPNSPMSNLFSALTVDNAGNLWAGSGISPYLGGLYNYDGKLWHNFDLGNPKEITTRAYCHLSSMADGSVVCSTWGAGFDLYKNGKFRVFNTGNTNLTGIPADHKFLVINGSKQDSKGNLWILNYWSNSGQPIAMMNSDSSFTQYSLLGNSLNPEIIKAEHMTIDQYDTKWFASTATDTKRGLYYFNEEGTPSNLTDDVWGMVGTNNGLNSDLITAVALDNRGELWVGSVSGINVIPDPAYPSQGITSIYAMRQQSVTAILVDPLDRKWVGTTKGLFLMNSDGTQLLQEFNSANSPLPDDYIKSLAADENTGEIYIGTDYGLSSVKTLAIKPMDSASGLFVYPNPLLIGPDNGKTLKIDRLIKNATIRIISVEGRTVTEFQSPGGRIAVWDGKDNQGQYVSSGIYIIAAYDQDGNSVSRTKVAVFRK